MTITSAPVAALPPVATPTPPTTMVGTAPTAPTVTTPDLIQTLTQLTQALSGLVAVLQGAGSVQGGGGAPTPPPSPANDGCPCCAADQALAGVEAGGAAAAPAQPDATASAAAPPATPAPASTPPAAAAKPSIDFSAAAPTSLKKPLDKFTISDHWGVVGDLRGGRAHTGLDMAAPSGTPIHAAAAGKVVKVVHSQGKEGLGTYVIIEHPGKLFTVYGHQSATNAKEGDIVQAGDEIGKVGSTGFSTGPHLHFEVRPGGADAESIDPEKFF